MLFVDRDVDLSIPRVMGVLNVTPDSFSDGGCYKSLDSALIRAEKMVQEGAHFIDVGGESTRPGAVSVSLDEELQRVCPVIEKITANLDVVVSVDTSAPEVMRESVALGAALINDVRAFQRPGAALAASELQVPLCLMHMQGSPDMMQDNPSYNSVMESVKSFLSDRVQALIDSGVPKSRLLVDPGFGFGKTLPHNLQLLNGVDQLVEMGYPVLVGLSRKSMIGAILDKPVEERMIGSVSAATIAAYKGASILRVHDVLETADAVSVVRALLEVSGE